MPTASTSFISNCVTMSSPFRARGTLSESTLRQITTPAACSEVFFGVPSSFKPISITRCSSSLFSYTAINSALRLDFWSASFFSRSFLSSAFKSGFCSFFSMPAIFSPSNSLMEDLPSISFATLSVSEYGTPITRPTSLITAREARVPNVTICATLEGLYFCRTYSMVS